MTPETIPQRIRSISEVYYSTPAQMSRPGGKTPEKDNGFRTYIYKDYWDEVTRFGAGLVTLGLAPGARVGMIADNCREWSVTDLAILGLGAANIPRGSDSTRDEVAYILNHAECVAVVTDDHHQTEKVLSGFTEKSPLKFLIALDDSLPAHRKAPSSLQLLNYSEVLNRGTQALKADPQLFDRRVNQGKADDLATIIYTSGTTGEPKGVMLTHRSFTFQVDRVYEVLNIKNRDVFLSVLPVWHAYERAIEYVVLCAGATLAYSKPIGKVMLEDMAVLKPQWFISVPRIWESIRSSIYRNVKAKGKAVEGLFNFFVAAGSTYADLKDKFLGRWPRFTPHWNLPTQVWTALPLLVLWPTKTLGSVLLFRKLRGLLGDRFIAGISGGGALPAHVDQFFRAIGVLVLEGYGLTECGPVLGVRVQRRPVPKTVGPLFRGIEVKVLDEETGRPVGPGHKGELWVKTPQVMQGYYKRPDATAKVLQDGWLNTGDLVRATVRNEIQIVGRTKDTIVLRGGENIEPEPIEQKLLQSEFIDQIMVVGQDQKYLGALIVPNYDLLEKFARERRITYLDKEELLDNSQILEVVHEVIQHLVNPRTGFKSFERVFRFQLLPRAFQVGVEMTQKLTLKRNVIAERYKDRIKALFDQNEGE